MEKTKRIVEVVTEYDDFWRLVPGTKYEVKKEYFRNGEHHLITQNLISGKIKEYPSIFFEEI